MDSMSMQFLKKVSTLRQVVELGGLSKVAHHNKISISAVSQAISSLEKALDRKLFVRDGGRLVPTQHCRRILNSATPAFQAIEAFSQVFHPSAPDTPSLAWLDFGVSQCIASDLLPRLVKKLKAELPELRLKLKTGRCESLLHLVKKDKLCMALIAADEIPKGISAYPIFEERLGIYFSNERSLAADAIRQGNFAGLAPETEGYPVYYTRFLRSLGLNSASVSALKVTCDHYESLYDLAVAGIMPAVLPERLATRSKGLLREVTPPQKNAAAGHFSVYLISQKNCDPDEDQFLLRELRSQL
jgi:DNA-binding transcriptional LysR family regulator